MRNKWQTLAGLAAAVALAAGLPGCGNALETGDSVAQVGKTLTITLPGGETMEMVWCPPGSFTMGSPEDEEGRNRDERQFLATLTEGFWMAKTEVTQKQWESVMGKPESFKFMMHRGDDLPMEYVSWEECQEFCRKAGNGLRLPTEAEWEYACRAGSGEPYAGTGRLHDMGWYFDGQQWSTHPVGQKKPNAWGLHDMHGNVAEWCRDWYAPYPSGNAIDPQGPPSGESRVVRGGGFGDDASKCRSADRVDQDPEDRSGSIGFRPVCPGKTRSKAAPGKRKDAGEETRFRRLGGLADTKGKGENMKLYGMFGASFGRVLPESEPCTTNSAGELVYSYRPRKAMDRFGDYHLLATPLTRKIFGIQAVSWEGSRVDDAVFKDAVALLEERFDRASAAMGENARGFKFANGNEVVVKPEFGRMYIHARNPELGRLAARESGEVEDERLAEDIRTLALCPARRGTEPLDRLDSVFGIVLGEPCRWGRNPHENTSQAWCYEFASDGPFLGCSNFVIFATSESKRVFIVRAAFDGRSDDEAQDKYTQMRRVLERLTGREFRDVKAEGNDKSCRMDLGGHFLVLLNKDWMTNKVLLDFCDSELYAANEREAEEKNGREAERAGEPKTITLPGGAEMEMVWCPPGKFLMGSPGSYRNGLYDQPRHPVVISRGFWMARTEVTQAQWKSVMGNNPSEHKGDNLPVENVSWDDCAEFCRKAGLELPTGEEWEYACRAGSTGPYGGTGRMEDMGWYDENSGRETHPVGRKTPNAWGLHDMHGNVSEWEADAADNRYPGDHYYRGGSYYAEARFCRSVDRHWRYHGDGSDTTGFRPVAHQIAEGMTP